MDKIEIKELTLEDIPDYVKVNTLAWQESYKGLIADSILDEVLNNCLLYTSDAADEL